MVGPNSFRPALAGLLFVLAGAAGAQAMSALDAVAPGEWRLHEIGSKGAAKSICVSDPRLLLQVEHGTTACARFVVAQTPHSATIRYTCPGRGHGLTTIIVESGTVVRLQTQGLFRGAPFDLDYEGRWQGRCA